MKRNDIIWVALIALAFGILIGFSLNPPPVQCNTNIEYDYFEKWFHEINGSEYVYTPNITYNKYWRDDLK